jgi:hypothetical protein
MIKISQKKTCNGCKALDLRQNTSQCLLCYSFDEEFKPKEPCPKPKTYMEFIECRENYQKE